MIKSSLRFTLLLCSVFGFGSVLKAQQFGGNPPSIHWKQIITKEARVVYPFGLDSIAKKISIITGSLAPTAQTLGGKNRRIPILLQNQTTVSNGYVGLGPWRSEFFMTPNQNSFELGSLPWYEQLATHEFRHVQQFANFNKGITKASYIFGGQLAVTLVANAAVPNWFWEGDAVYQETQQTNQGRGRLPYFFNSYRSLWLANKNYSWMKLRNGSLRDYVPSHYDLGYLLTAYGREKYGADFWGKVTNDAARFKGLFYPFQSGIKRATGKSYTQFVNEALQFYKNQLVSETDTIHQFAASKKHFVSEEEYPQWLDKDHYVYVSSSYKRIPYFVSKNVKTGDEKKIRLKDLSLDAYFSVRNQQIVYAAVGYDLRWGWRNYSEIRLLDATTGEQRTITKHTKLFSPDINAKGDRIVAVQQTTDGKNSVELLDAVEGKTIKSFPNNQQYYYTGPKFLNAQTIVVAARNQDGQMGITKLDISTGKETVLLPFQWQVIGFLNTHNDSLYYTMSWGNADHLFLYDGKSFFKMDRGTVNTGAYQLAANGAKAVWTEFTAVGQQIVNTDLNKLRWEAVDPSKSARFNFGVNAIESGRLPLKDSTPSKTKYFSKAFNLFNFHSWLPDFNDPEYTLTFISENVLNTLQSDLSFTYNTNEKAKKIGYIATYGAWFPWIRMGVNYNKDRAFTYNNDLVRWNEFESRVGVSIPLNFSGKKYFRNLRLTSDFVLNKPDYLGKYKDTFDRRSFTYVVSNLSYVQQLPTAKMQIYPRFAKSLLLTFYKTATRVNGYQFLANGTVYLPGLAATHSLVINAAVHRRDTIRDIFFSNSFPFSRGYVARNFHQMMKAGVNYHFPILYPDKGVASIVYVQRIRANAFFDYTKIAEYNTQRRLVNLEYRSTGGEIYFDTKWWNQQPVSFGLRYSYLLDASLQGLSPHQFEFVLPVNLISR